MNTQEEDTEEPHEAVFRRETSVTTGFKTVESGKNSYKDETQVDGSSIDLKNRTEDVKTQLINPAILETRNIHQRKDFRRNLRRLNQTFIRFQVGALSFTGHFT